MLRAHYAAFVAFAVAAPAAALAQGHPLSIAASRDSAPADFRAQDQQVDLMVRARDLRVRQSLADPLVAGRSHERLDQYVRGVRIVGGDLTRQLAPDGTVSLFGTLHAGLDIPLTPSLTPDEARGAIADAVSGRYASDEPELVVLPLSDGYHLAYAGQAVAHQELLNVYVDAASGALLQQFSEYITEVGSGKGAYGDTKKVSATSQAGGFIASDPLRPGAITTYDMKGNFSRTTDILNRITTVAASDVASDTDNVWTDPTVVDAHTYAGWYYDYLFKRFGRHGIDGNDLRIAAFTHPVRLEDIASASADVRGLFYVNAFFCPSCGPNGRGAVTFGEGAPRGFYGNFEVKPFSAALDVVAHELTHAVTASSARLNGFPYSEAGALNEAFSDVIGISTAFYFEPAGTAPLSAGYEQGRDLTVPGGVIGRSLSNPASSGDADHYLLRSIGGDPHYNGVILGHAFYLAIEGGRNRVSGLTVQGVGAANREQIEKSFFRALTVLLPSNSTYALARGATIQAATDLYGASSAAARAITQAWDAVGVQPRTAPTTTAITNPATATAATAATCGASPSWFLYTTVSGGSGNLRITGWSSDDFDAAGTTIDHSVYSAASFSGSFNACGPGSTTVLAQTDACSALCWYLKPGVTVGSTQLTFTATDEAGRIVTFSTPRVTLR
jgi:bacillolysin